MKNINLDEVSLKNAVRLMMDNTEFQTFKEVAESLEIPKSTFQSALDKDYLRFRDFLKVADLLGYSIKLEKK
jgi:5-bromo-4-chloroindolyl phosphate hydrolysis protein